MQRVRKLLVALLAAWAAFQIFAPFSELIFTPGGFGSPANSATSRVEFVVPGSPGDRAGIVVGDIVDESATPFEQRRLSGHRPPIGMSETVRIVHDGRSRIVTLVAVPLSRALSPDELLQLSAEAFVALAWVVLGAVLVLLRPSRLTWAFYVFCVGLNPLTGTFGAMWYLPHWLFFVLGGFADLLDAAAWASIFIFASRLPRNDATGRASRFADRAAPAIFAAFFVFQIYMDFIASNVNAVRLGTAIAAALYAGALAVLISNYRHADAEARQRIRWVAVGVAVAAGTHVVLADIPQALPGIDFPQWLDVPVTVLNLALPLSVVYAILRYRVFDVSFAISRTLAITAISSVIIALFSLADSAFQTRVASSQLGVLAEITIAIVVSLSMHALHHRVTDLFDRLLFRRRHAAARMLEAAAHALPQADSEAEVARMLVTVPCEALRLRSGALFRLQPDGSYRLACIVGDFRSQPSVLSADDDLIRGATADLKSGPIALRGRFHNRLDAASSDGDEPALGLPITSQRRLIALALYGVQANGVDFDPDQLRNIGSLALGARVAYGELEAVELRAQVDDSETLRRQNEALQRQNEALRAQHKSSRRRPPRTT